jgi:hypothetical protein
VQPLEPAVLFSQDNTTLRVNDEESYDGGRGAEDDEAEHAAFLEAVADTVATALRSPSQVPNTTYALKDIRTLHQKQNGDVARVVVELILAHVADHHDDAGEAIKAVSAVLAQWATPFFNDFVLQDSDMEKVLRGAAVALNGPAKALLGKSNKVLEQLFSGCDPDLFDSRGWCIVSGQALLAFDGLAESYESIPEAERSAEQVAVVAVGQRCIKYINSVREYLEEDA